MNVLGVSYALQVFNKLSFISSFIGLHNQTSPSSGQSLPPISISLHAISTSTTQ
jgi:hypothetical protein